jgi:hypothetical protein
MSHPVTHPRRGVDIKHCTYRLSRETTTPWAISTSMNIDKAKAILDFTCYNCGEKGHKARYCKKPPQPKVHIRAAHTEDSSRSEYGSDTSEDDHQSEQAEMAHREDHNEEIIKVEVLEDSYSNDYYENNEADFMASMISTMNPTSEGHGTPPSDPTNNIPVHMWKVTM